MEQYRDDFANNLKYYMGKFNLSAYTPTFYSNKDIMNKPVRIIGKVVESRHKW